MATPYPSTFPSPNKEGHENSPDYGIVSSDFRPGKLTTRRDFNRARNRFRLSFIVPVADVGTWVTWARANAWKGAGISMNLPSLATTVAEGRVSEHEVKFTSSLAYNFREDSQVEITVEAEVIAGGLGSLDLGGNYYEGDIDGGFASSPSTDGPIDGGSAAVPSTADVIEAGSPANAHV